MERSFIFSAFVIFGRLDPLRWITLCVFMIKIVLLSAQNVSDSTLEAPLLTKATASFNMRGIKGYVTFTERPLQQSSLFVDFANSTTAIAGSLAPDVAPVMTSRLGLSTTVSVEYEIHNFQWTTRDAKDDVFLVIREFPVVWNAAGDRCADPVLGKQLFSREFQIGPVRSNSTISGTLDNLDIPLHGPKSIRGRSLLMVTAKNHRACTTIAPYDFRQTRTAVARLQGNMAGNIYFRQFIAPPSDTTIFSDIYKLVPDGVASNVTYRWQLMTTGPLDRTRPEDQISCRNMRVLFDPDFREEQGRCSVSTPEGCKIGNMMGKFGGLPVGLPDGQARRAFFTDPDFTLSGWSTGRGIYVALFHPNNPLVSIACGEVRLLRPKLAQASFNQDGVRGSVKFRQTSQFDPTEVYVGLHGLSGRATKLAIHEFPRRQKLRAGENLCTPSLIGQVFDPLKSARPAVPVRNISSSTQDQVGIGDLSSKVIGLDLTGQDGLDVEFLDDNLPLFGSLSVIGRTVAVYGANQSRWICSNIWPDGDLVMAKAQYFYGVGGVIYLRQSAEDFGGETTIFGNLYYTNGIQATITHNHNWKVHWSPVMRDAFSWDGRCVSAGEVYDPMGVDVRKNYSTECQPTRAFRCQMGDLSARLAPLTVALTASEGSGRFFFTETYLPLAGPLSAMGKSIVIYSKELGDQRQACATIVPVHPTKAYVKDWIGSGAGKVQGSVTAQQSTGDQETAISIGLDGLARTASTMTVHVGPVEENLVIPCTEESLGPVYDPFDAADAAANGTGTGNLTSSDIWPIGDLSDKYGSLMGLTSYARQAFDESVPLIGPYSIIGRAIGLQPDREARGFVCGDVEHDVRNMEKVTVLKAVAQFPGPFLWGYIRFTQVQYEVDGASSGMTINVRLAHMLNDSIDYYRSSTGHRWAIHQLPVAGDASSLWDNFRCITAGLVDNYFNSVNEGDEYRSECWMGNVQRCAYGDVTPRLGTMNISFDARQVFTDELLQLKGNVSLIGRSVVIFDVREEDNKEIRMACANIEEEEEVSVTLLLQQTGNFDSAGFEARVADLVDLKPWSVSVNQAKIQRMNQNSCIQVLLTLRAPKATVAIRTLNNFVDLDQFKYIGYESCDKRTDKLWENLVAAAKGTRTLRESDLTSGAVSIYSTATALKFSLSALAVLFL